MVRSFDPHPSHPTAPPSVKKTRNRTHTRHTRHTHLRCAWCIALPPALLPWVSATPLLSDPMPGIIRCAQNPRAAPERDTAQAHPSFFNVRVWRNTGRSARALLKPKRNSHHDPPPHPSFFGLCRMPLPKVSKRMLFTSSSLPFLRRRPIPETPVHRNSMKKGLGRRRRGVADDCLRREGRIRRCCWLLPTAPIITNDAGGMRFMQIARGGRERPRPINHLRKEREK